MDCAGRVQRRRRFLAPEPCIDPMGSPAYAAHMNAVEFITELRGAAVLQIPAEAAAQLPKTGKVRVIVLSEDADAAYPQLTPEELGHLAGRMVETKDTIEADRLQKKIVRGFYGGEAHA